MCRFPTLAFLVFSVLPAAAAVRGPYAADAATVHLFHLDESAGASVSANSGGTTSVLLAFNGSAVPATATTAQPANTTILGAASYSGFGNSADLSSAALGLGLDANGSGGFQPGTNTCPDAVTHSTLADPDGSFTIEALVSLPAITGTPREIVATDSSMTGRGFQFRIGNTGLLEFNFISGSGALASVTIPTSGEHGFMAGEWFHVALAFDGITGTSTFYWTRVALAPEEANVIGTSSLESTVGTVTGPLVIGNEGRAASAESLLGLIDEVRISKAARGAGDFIFHDDDSDDDGLADPWELLHFDNLEQTGTDDPDLDSYTNAAELASGTDPGNPLSNPDDIDADGLPDVWEVQHFGSTGAQEGEGDPDGDFASNELEQAGGSFPRDPLSWPDTDSDGMNDGWERQYFAGLDHDGSVDGDADGFNDQEEHDANTHPLDGAWSPDHAKLAHRWSFNGDLGDSVGGRTATLADPDEDVGTAPATLGAADVLLTGGTRTEAAYIDLGAGLIGGKKTPVTIELWAAQIATRNWARIFDIGSGPTEYVMMTWTQGSTLASDQVRWLDTASVLKNNTASPYTTGVKHHIVLVIEPRAGAGGGTRVSWHAAPATAPALGPAKGSFDTADTLLDLQDNLAWLGRSMYTGDATTNARYDECRIWNGKLGARQREDLHLFGPDAADYGDSDNDGLPDGWEMACFQNLDESAGDDPDGVARQIRKARRLGGDLDMPGLARGA